MGIERITAEALAFEAARAVGLQPSTATILSDEGLAASVRRAASFLCPTTTRALVDAVVEVLSVLTGYGQETERDIETLVQSLVGYGDLLELSIETDGRKRRHLFLGAPAYVRRTDTSALLLGIRPDGAPLVSDELLSGVQSKGHVRLIRSLDDLPIADVLSQEGLLELQPNQWMRAPRPSAPDELVSFYVTRLQAAERRAIFRAFE